MNLSTNVPSFFLAKEDSASVARASSKVGGTSVGGDVEEGTSAGDCGRRGADAAKVCPFLIQGSQVPNATSNT